MKNNSEIIEPEIGMGVTICYWSDRMAGTIVDISASGKTLIIQEDNSFRIDNNGMSDCQEYTYSPNPNGQTHVATKRKDGSFRLMKSKTLISIGHRRTFHDYSF